MSQLFVDLDGVLADFDTGYEQLAGWRPMRNLTRDVDWSLVKSTHGFYTGLPRMPDFHLLWDNIEQYKPIILTGIPHSVQEAEHNKRAWVDENIGRHIRMIATLSSLKSAYCQPGDILIDDWEKYKDLWVNAGGKWITHTDAESTLSKLAAIF